MLRAPGTQHAGASQRECLSQSLKGKGPVRKLSCDVRKKSELTNHRKTREP